MTIKSAPSYWLECDDCGANSTEGGEYSGWDDGGIARDEARAVAWFCEDGHDWCGQCRTKHVCSECDKITDDLVPLEDDGYWPVCRDCNEVDGYTPEWTI